MEQPRTCTDPLSSSDFARDCFKEQSTDALNKLPPLRVHTEIQGTLSQRFLSALYTTARSWSSMCRLYSMGSPSLHRKEAGAGVRTMNRPGIRLSAGSRLSVLAFRVMIVHPHACLYVIGLANLGTWVDRILPDYASGDQHTSASVTSPFDRGAVDTSGSLTWVL